MCVVAYWRLPAYSVQVSKRRKVARVIESASNAASYFMQMHTGAHRVNSLVATLTQPGMHKASAVHDYIVSHHAMLQGSCGALRLLHC